MPGIDIAPVLETPRLRLRPHRREDFDESAAMWADETVVRHITGRPATREEAWSRLLRYAGHWPLLGFGYWVVEAREDGRFVGEVGFADFQRDLTPAPRGRPEAGWVLKASEHGQGFATEAVTGMLNWGDRYLPGPETFCMVAPQHVASIRVARRVGYGQDLTGTYRGESVLLLSRRAAPQPATGVD